MKVCKQINKKNKYFCGPKFLCGMSALNVSITQCTHIVSFFIYNLSESQFVVRSQLGFSI